MLLTHKNNIGMIVQSKIAARCALFSCCCIYWLHRPKMEGPNGADHAANA